MTKKSRNLMDGTRVRDHLSQEAKSLIATYRQFEALVRSTDRQGSSHPPEEGRYVESLIRDCLRKFLPKDLHVGSGFILRPAVKTGENGRERRGKKDQVSKQLDVLVVDCARYPTFQRFEDAMIVPPEGVVGIISVKKNLRKQDLARECGSLLQASRLCQTLDKSGKPVRGPYLALVGMDYKSGSVQKFQKDVFEKILSSYKQSPPVFFDDMIGFVGAITKGSAFKSRPNCPCDVAEYVWHTYKMSEEDNMEKEEHLALQFLITGILSVYYDASRSTVRRPGFTGFESARPHDSVLGEVPVTGIRRSSFSQ